MKRATVTATPTSGEPKALPTSVRELLAARGLGDVAVRFAAASATRVDTGGWLRGDRLWAMVVGDRFVLAAAGSRPYFLELPLAGLAAAVYNHVTGGLVFPKAPAGPDVPPVLLDPLVARSLLALAASPPSISPGTLCHA